ncbi:MAG TPA: insulinase family protein, partial [Bdellovibrionota bacterium]|nr:insulinase family protein [Bdellovibrionota bacterium]
KNNKKYPRYGSLSRTLMELGGEIQGSTTIDYAEYGTVVPSKYLIDALDIFADSYRNPDLDPTLLNNTINTIIRDGNVSFEFISGYPIEILPDPTEIGNLKRDQILEYWKERYHPGHLIIAIVGDISAGKAYRAIKKSFGGIPGKGEPKAVEQRTPAQEKFQFEQTAIPEGNFGLVTFQTEGLTHPDRYPLFLTSLWLKNKFPTEARIARDSGIFQFILEPKGQSILDLEKTFFEELEKLKTTPIPTEELKVFRAQTIFEGLRRQEKIQDIASQLAIEEQYGDYQTTFLEGYRLAAVTAEDVQRIAKSHFSLNQARVREFSDRFPTGRIESNVRKEQLQQVTTVPTETPSAIPQEVKNIPPIEPIAQPKPEHITPKVFRLSRDIPLILQERHYLPLVAVSIKSILSRRYETAKNIGITNLAMGTVLRTPQNEGMLPSSIVASLGGKIAVSTTVDDAGFGMEILSTNLKEGIALLTKIIGNPQVNSSALQGERSKLVQEIDDQVRTPFDNAIQLALETIYGDHPYVYPEAGQTEALNSITLDQVKTWLSQMFAPENLIISVVGDVDETQIRTWFEEGLRTLQTSKVPLPEAPSLPTWPSVVRKNVKAYPFSYSAQAILFQAPGLADPDFPALNVLSAITGGPGGRFSEALMEKRQLAYRVATTPMWSKLGNAFAILLQVPPGEEAASRNLIFRDIKSIQQNGIPKAELERGKNYQLTQDLISLQGNLELANRYGSSFVMGLKETWISDYQKQLSAISSDDVQRVATQYLMPRKYVVGQARSEETAPDTE